jgi:hypothetical protein
MGTSRWSPDEWVTYSSTVSSKSTDEIFRSRTMNADLDPKGVAMRESRDSDLNPESTAVIVACDVTGSMGMLADNLIREGMGTLFEEIIERKPVSDPHVMAMAIGDATMYDTAPLQVSQFEADLTIVDQLESVYIEGGGGGNSFESYDLPMYFAAYHTSIDCFEKRGNKGYLFTLGDEKAPPCTTRASVEKFIGDDGLQADIPMKDVVEAAQKMYNVFHIIVAEGYYASNHLDEVRLSWNEVLGQNVIVLSDYTKLAEVIVSIMEVNEGKSAEEVASSWSGDTSMVVADAVKDMTAKASFDKAMGSVTRF